MKEEKIQIGATLSLIAWVGLALVVIFAIGQCGGPKTDNDKAWKPLLDQSSDWSGKNTNPGYHPFILFKIEETEKSLKFQNNSNELWTNYRGAETTTSAIYYYSLDKTTGKGTWIGKKTNILRSEGEVISSGDLYLTGYEEGKLTFAYVTEYNNPKRIVDSATMRGEFVVTSY